MSDSVQGDRMRKHPTWNLDLEKPPSRNRFGTALTGLILLALLPLIFDGTKICVAQWRSLNGPIVTARTPVIDFLSELFQTAGAEVRRLTGPMFTDQPWKPQVVIPVTLFWTGIGVWLLKRG